MWTLKYGETRQISVESSKLKKENQEYYASPERTASNVMIRCCCGVASREACCWRRWLRSRYLRNRKNKPLKVRVKKF